MPVSGPEPFQHGTESNTLNFKTKFQAFNKTVVIVGTPMYVLEQQLLSNFPIVKVQKFFMYSGHIDSFDLDLAGTKKSIL